MAALNAGQCARTGAEDARIAIVVPVLDDARALAQLLDTIRSWGAGAFEVIVVTGSEDTEIEQLCATHGHRCIRAAPSRGRQLDVGARAARAPVLWFVHADAVLPADGLERIRAAHARGAEAGFFEFSFEGPPTAMKSLLERLIALRVLLGGIPYGDQALFATREAYLACGGFPPQPLFEEVRLVRRLRRRGRFVKIRRRVGVSTRRWERDGWWRRTLRNRWLAICHMLGVRPERLIRAYSQSKQVDDTEPRHRP